MADQTSEETVDPKETPGGEGPQTGGPPADRHGHEGYEPDPSYNYWKQYTAAFLFWVLTTFLVYRLSVVILPADSVGEGGGLELAIRVLAAVIWGVGTGIPAWMYRGNVGEFINKNMFSVDHKTIGKQYLGLGMIWLFVGGFLAWMFRSQLSDPGEELLIKLGWLPDVNLGLFEITPTDVEVGSLLASIQGWINSRVLPELQPIIDNTINMVAGENMQMVLEMSIIHPEGHLTLSMYNMAITMHGTIMLFFVAMPILIGFFGNFCVPLMIGADDMAFPRINMLSFWTLVTGSVILALSFLVGEGPANAGWTAYAPLSADPIYAGKSIGWGMNLWLIAVIFEFASILLGGVNIITTTFKMRAPGLSLFRLPILVWMQVLAAFMFLLSVGPLIAGGFMLLLDRIAGTAFFVSEQGGDPLLWQHLFWFFGHPEVYVVFLPGVGIILEIIPTFSRKKIFGYRPILYMAFAAGFLSFLVWAHHMFVSGMDPRLAAPFMITTILISDPFALMVFAIILTMWGGAIDLKTPMLFAIGTLLIFIIGGVTGIYLGAVPVDIYMHETVFVVAHFHYTMFASVIFGGFAGIYYWWPKMFGRLMNDFWGKVHFLFTFIGFNGVFLPMFLLGLGGHRRRIADPTSSGILEDIQYLNEYATIFALILLVGQIPFVINMVYSRFWGEESGRNPWNANTLEWVAPSPPGHGNFDKIPVVYRGPYEYSSPHVREDYLPQNVDLSERDEGEEEES